MKSPDRATTIPRVRCVATNKKATPAEQTELARTLDFTPPQDDR